MLVDHLKSVNYEVAIKLSLSVIHVQYKDHMLNKQHTVEQRIYTIYWLVK